MERKRNEKVRRKSGSVKRALLVKNFVLSFSQLGIASADLTNTY